MKKLHLITTILFLLILSSCGQSNTDTTDEIVEVDREITITGYTGPDMEDFRFEPEEIVLKKGETVKFTLTTDNNVSHGIQFHGTKLILSERAPEVYTANEVGEYKGLCTKLCGIGHATMTISLIVEE